MDGLRGEYLLHLSSNFEAKAQTLDSPQYKNQEKTTNEVLAFLRKIALSHDIHLLLDVERLAMEHSLKYDTNSPEEGQSVKAALEQLAMCKKCLNSLVSNPEGYREIVDPTYSNKTREAGLPLDAARQFFKSHTARLNNNLVSKSFTCRKTAS